MNSAGAGGGGCYPWFTPHAPARAHTKVTAHNIRFHPCEGVWQLGVRGCVHTDTLSYALCTTMIWMDASPNCALAQGVPKQCEKALAHVTSVK